MRRWWYDARKFGFINSVDKVNLPPLMRFKSSRFERSPSLLTRIRSDEGIALETGALNLFTVHILLINSVDKTKLFGTTIQRVIE